MLAAGTVAYRALGLGWIDAFYQTLITVSTVGYGEIGTEVDARYRLVTVVVILLGVGVALYTITVWFDGLLEGHFRGELERKRMQRALDALEGHTIICGWGQVGQAIGRSVIGYGRQVVIVEQNPDIEIDARMESAILVTGNAIEDEVLERAGIDRAKDLVIALDDDADAMYVLVTARGINPDIHIVCRANARTAAPKLRQAGADRVVNPHEIGGTRMAAFVLAPTVADFLGETMHGFELELRLDQLTVEAGSQIAERPGRQIELLENLGLAVLAVHHKEGHWTHRIVDDLVLDLGDVVVALGTSDQHDEARTLVASR